MRPEEIQKILHNSIALKPKDLVISDLKWKYLIRAILLSKNILIVGPSGCAKTTAARSAAKVLNRPFEKINFGSTQDARATLIGNTTYKKEIGTVFHKSSFVKAITTPNTIVLLDEFSRGTHDAHNIILPVIDPIQRCLRLDEDDDGSLIKVADGVSFVATANIGNEYTATKVLDKAITRRFPIKLEMSPISSKELIKLIEVMFPQTSGEQNKLIISLISIYDDILSQCNLEDASISNIISPANMIEMVELVLDGFSLSEIAEAAIYPEYPDESGADSERAFIKSVLQKYFPKKVKSPINDPLKKNSNDNDDDLDV